MATIYDVILMVVSFLTSLFVVLIFIVLGWYIVWVAFLSRFKLMRELLSINDDDSSKSNDAKGIQETDPSVSNRRTRQHTSQRS